VMFTRKINVLEILQSRCKCSYTEAIVVIVAYIAFELIW
jgi:excisionase family DNA binding protein